MKDGTAIKGKDSDSIFLMPELLISEALPQIENINELKVILLLFMMVSKLGTGQRFITFSEIARNPLWEKSIVGESSMREQVVTNALDLAVKHGIVVRAILDKKGTIEKAYLLSTEYEQIIASRLRQQQVVVDETSEYDSGLQNKRLAGIFNLYEQNIGILTPLIADELRDAAKNYPVEWIENAIKEATTLNKRNWKYILRILERWAVEGKDYGEFGRDTKKEASSGGKYIKGRYGHMVER